MTPQHIQAPYIAMFPVIARAEVVNVVMFATLFAGTAHFVAQALDVTRKDYPDCYAQLHAICPLACAS